VFVLIEHNSNTKEATDLKIRGFLQLLDALPSGLESKNPTSSRSGGSADGCQQIKRQRGALKPQDSSGDPDHQPAGILFKKR
jgi:hypothetical protein